MSEDKLQKQSDSEKKLVDTTPEQGRRRLLKKSVAIPIIMTLSSGAAAQAVTSNLVSNSTTDPYMVEDKVACFDYDNSVTFDDGHTKYDLGDTITYTLEDDVNACATRDGGGGIVISSNTFMTSIADKNPIDRTLNL